MSAQEMSGCTRVFNFDVNSTMFNVIIMWESPCGGLHPVRAAERCNATPLEWSRACIWVRGILTGIGKQWTGSKYHDIYIEPAECPRPWTPEIYAMFQRQMRVDMSTPSIQQRITEVDDLIQNGELGAERARLLQIKQAEINRLMDYGGVAG